jgi:hypothetical protein
VGSWTATDETHGGTNVGGAGQTYVFNSNGTADQSYAGSTPIAGHTYDGTASATYTLTPSSTTATSGSITISYVSGNVTVSVGGTTTKIPLAPATFNWTCNGSTAVLSANTAAGTYNVNLTRQP